MCLYSPAAAQQHLAEVSNNNATCLLQVTLQHLRTVDSIIRAAATACSPPCPLDPAVTKLLSNAEASTTKFYENLCAGELMLLRSTLARYFQDKRVR
jgi:hypothetical protein